ncbi:MAG: hypothetical protein AB2376_16000 [Clostridium sp.]
MKYFLYYHAIIHIYQYIFIIINSSHGIYELFNDSLDAANVSSKDWIDKLNKTVDFTVKKGYDTSLYYNFFNQEERKKL